VVTVTVARFVRSGAKNALKRRVRGDGKDQKPGQGAQVAAPRQHRQPRDAAPGQYRTDPEQKTAGHDQQTTGRDTA
jgi:hypothetical protein